MTTQDQNAELLVNNYAVAFIDLLGQRAALRGQNLVPSAETKEQRRELIDSLRASVGAIASLQQMAEKMEKASEPDADMGHVELHAPEQKAVLQAMHQTCVETQRWSDGLMLFSNLGNESIKCPVGNVYNLFVRAGALCFIGLASKKPLRGAIEIAWGVQLHPGELYGAAVARAYELESEVADYPRIVVGPQMLGFLDHYASIEPQNVFEELDKELASLCKGMLVRDMDGHWIIHYLGDFFYRVASREDHRQLYDHAYKFIVDQINTHRSTQNSKLAFRYMHLLNYFSSHIPGDLQMGEQEKGA